MKIAILFMAALAIAGCVNNMPVVEKGDNIAVDYTGKLEDGTVFDTSIGRAPLEFTAGGGQMIKGFDLAVIGMKLNESKTITIAPEDAYGVSDPSLIFNVSISSIPNGTKAGDTLYSQGRPVRVIEVSNDTAVIDANHPLAGKTLIFSIKIVGITKPNSTQ